MIQSPTELKVNLCSPQYFYNISQQHNFIVYDLRPTECIQELKNTFKLDSVFHIQDLNTLQSTQDLEEYQSDKTHPSKRVKISPLFNQRKRIFNFFLPFNASDSFSIYLSDYIFSLDEAKNYSLDDYVTISVKSLENVCLKFKEKKKISSNCNSPKNNLKENNSPSISSNFKINNLNKQFSLESSQDIEKNQQDKRLAKFHYPSTPNLITYNILDQAITNREVFQCMLQVIKIFKEEKFREVFIIYEPAIILFEQYPLLNYRVHKNRKFLDKNLPNEIVTGKLYLGNADHAMNEDLLVDSLKITHIINAAKEVQSDLDTVKYLNIPITDEVTEKIFKHFDVVYQFIDQLWDDENSRILIHCAQGRSRSAALVMMFLMRKFNWNLEKTYKYVQERREMVSVNDGFLQQLKNYESFLFEKQQ